MTNTLQKLQTFSPGSIDFPCCFLSVSFPIFFKYTLQTDVVSVEYGQLISG